MALRNVALLGADGSLGPSVLQALVECGSFSVTILKRASSRSPDTYPAGVAVHRIADGFEHDDLVSALQGQDAVVVTVAGSHIDVQKKLADAAVAAGVRRFIPADFGSCDSQSDYARQLVPLYVKKALMREYLEELAAKTPTFQWTSLVNGHFFDWQLKFLHIDVPNRKVDILDDGKTKWSAATLGQIGKAVAKVLEKHDLEATQNKLLYIQSFCVTQLQVLDALKRVTGVENWTVESVNTEDFVVQESRKRDQGDKEAIEELVWVLGTKEANWENKPDFANALLGLEEENLDEVLKKAIAESS